MAKKKKKQQSPGDKQNEEILQYVYRVKNDPSDEEAFKVIVKCLNAYIRYLADNKFFFVPGAAADDVYQEGLCALATKAIPDYCETKGPFFGFAKLCVKRHVITCLKSASNGRNKTLNGAVSLDATVCNEEEGPVSIGGFLTNGEEDLFDRMVRQESHGRLKTSLRGRLTKLEAEVLDLYLKGLSYMDMVRVLNRKRRGKNRYKPKVIDNALCRIKKKAIELAEQFEEEE
jgi:RNA polymerase sporulation-specific sigma factor